MNMAGGAAIPFLWLARPLGIRPYTRVGLKTRTGI
jgi:hypothetical protein